MSSRSSPAEPIPLVLRPNDILCYIMSLYSKSRGQAYFGSLLVEVEVGVNVLRESLAIKTVASTLREVSHQQVAVKCC